MAKHPDNCEICRRIGEARKGHHAGLIAELDTGFAVMGDSQFFPGYSLLLCKHPATELDELDGRTRVRHLEEMAQLAQAVRSATGAVKINYECLGNQQPHMHWHVFPRRESDPRPLDPVWVQMPAPGSEESARTMFDPSAHGALLGAIKAELSEIRRTAG